ncbi:hypothetical protein [uncultured Aquimarina sp.]|uniref:hypothetical protein n=1 Tax=uncultured Aquimarina sp. TaxID=575652 RepID=UPI002626818B|nr:hypothetical protein [uncultured Aquimarina sp.]
MKNLILLSFLILSTLTFSQTEKSIYNQNKETVLEYFRKETNGGKLDFELKLKDDKAHFYGIGNVLYNRKDYGILLWATAIKKTKKLSRKEAIKLWEEIKEKKLTKPEKKAFKKGFKMELN